MDRHNVLAQFLRSHHVMTIATNGAGGPWAAAVFYANEGFDFYFLSAPGTRHARELVDDPRIAATIQDDCTAWLEIKGIQISGTARQVDGEEREYGRKLYGQKFPGILDETRVPAPIAAALRKINWYRLRATSVRLVDNSQGFGHRDEWTSGDSPA